MHSNEKERDMSSTIWLTGLSGAGKSTVAMALAEVLQQKGKACYVVDGDALRSGLCSDLGFDRHSRAVNIRRAAEVCRILNASGVIAIAALISPYQNDRDVARRIVGAQTFHEIWVSTPLDVCEQRDPKGLYQKARKGEISGFTGISDPYEIPKNPALVLNTQTLSVEECLAQLVQLPALQKQGVLK